MFKDLFEKYKKAIIIAVIVGIGSALGVPQAALQAVVTSVYEIVQKQNVDKVVEPVEKLKEETK